MRPEFTRLLALSKRNLRKAYEFLKERFTVARERWRIRHTTINPESPCPACGNRPGNRLQFSPNVKWPNGEIGALIRTCKTCNAQHGVPCIVPAKHWMIGAPTAPQEEPLPFLVP